MNGQRSATERYVSRQYEEYAATFVVLQLSGAELPPRLSLPLLFSCQELRLNGLMSLSPRRRLSDARAVTGESRQRRHRFLPPRMLLQHTLPADLPRPDARCTNAATLRF
jgi:hypothetical protein